MCCNQRPDSVSVGLMGLALPSECHRTFMVRIFSEVFNVLFI